MKLLISRERLIIFIDTSIMFIKNVNFISILLDYEQTLLLIIITPCT
jgi:hypothetical protein